jgi:hypothetical protein
VSIPVKQIHEYRVSYIKRDTSPIRDGVTFSTTEDELWEGVGGARGIALVTAEEYRRAGKKGVTVQVREVSAWRSAEVTPEECRKAYERMEELNP